MSNTREDRFTPEDRRAAMAAIALLILHWMNSSREKKLKLTDLLTPEQIHQLQLADFDKLTPEELSNYCSVGGTTSEEFYEQNKKWMSKFTDEELIGVMDAATDISDLCRLEYASRGLES